MATTTNLGITLLEAAQAQKEVTINQALMSLDALSGRHVEDKDLAAPPSSPVAGLLYIVANGATGAWSGKSQKLAYYHQTWRFIAPYAGLRLWVRDEAQYYEFDGTGWVSEASARIGAFSPLLGTSLSGWWDLNDYSTLTIVSTDKISVATDKSGNSNTANQANSFFGPQWSPTKFNSVAPGMYTGGTANLYVAPSSTVNNIFQNGGTLVASVIFTGSGTNQVLVGKTSDSYATSGYFVQFFGSGSLTMRFRHYFTSSNGTWDLTGALALNTPYLIEIYYNASTPTTAPIIRINGVLRTVTNTTAPSGSYVSDASGNLILGNFADGSTYPLLGTLGQVAVFKAAQTEEFATRLRCYLGALSGIHSAPIYVLAGQSNMVGYADATTSSFSFTPHLPTAMRPKIWDGNRFAPLVAGSTNQARNPISMGPELAFGVVQSAIIQQSAYLVKYAAGGTTLAVDWVPNTSYSGQFGLMQYRVDLAVAYLAGQGKIPVIMSFLWAQGETDAQTLSYANNYQTNLTAFAAALKTIAFPKYTLSPNYRFVISGLPAQSTTTLPYLTTVRNAQVTVGAATGNRYFSTLDLTLKTDLIHYDGTGAVNLGTRFARHTDPSFAQATLHDYSNQVTV